MKKYYTHIQALIFLNKNGDTFKASDLDSLIESGEILDFGKYTENVSRTPADSPYSTATSALHLPAMPICVETVNITTEQPAKAARAPMQPYGEIASNRALWKAGKMSTAEFAKLSGAIPSEQPSVA